MQEQLSLPVTLPDDQTFDSFISAGNEALLAHLHAPRQAGKSGACLTFIAGDAGSGKSHLLYAMCHQLSAAQQQVGYLDLQLLGQLQPAMLTGLEHYDLICIDNLHCLDGHQLWQEALFDLINRCIEVGRAHLVVTANSGPKSLPLQLADLQSRLSWGTTFSLSALQDDELQTMLIKRAQLRGMVMNQEVAHFILTRYTRHSHRLMDLLARLDQLSLQQQKKLTIPFVKQVLSL